VIVILVLVTAIFYISILALPVFFYIKYSMKADGKRRSFVLFGLGLVLFGYFAPGAISSILIGIACSANTSAPCGMSLGIMLVPIVLLFCLVSYLFAWKKRGGGFKDV
jgi:hypothetical protein